jgi:hypothetical protein
MNLVTHHTTKLKMMKTPQRMILAASMLTLTASSIVATTGTALAARGPCYKRDGYSFQHSYGSGYGIIDVWRGSGCSGSKILTGLTYYNKNTHMVTLRAIDRKSDNTGMTLYTHGPSVSSKGTDGEDGMVANLDPSSFSKPYHFWVRVGGTTNSSAASMMIPY